MCFFGDLYCTELHKVNFENRIKIWYRLISKNSGIEPAICRSVSKNSGIEPALLLLHTVSTGNCVLSEYLTYNVSIEYRVSNKIQVSIGIEQNLVSNQHYIRSTETSNDFNSRCIKMFVQAHFPKSQFSTIYTCTRARTHTHTHTHTHTIRVRHNTSCPHHSLPVPHQDEDRLLTGRRKPCRRVRQTLRQRGQLWVEVSQCQWRHAIEVRLYHIHTTA